MGRPHPDQASYDHAFLFAENTTFLFAENDTFVIAESDAFLFAGYINTAFVFNTDASFTYSMTGVLPFTL